MGYMANELAVKVKVNLDTSANALNTELRKITTYSQSHPATISVKVDSKSLKKSIEEAFGQGATQNMTNAANKVNDVSKNMNKLIGNMRELNKWEKQLATAQASPNFKTDEIDELSRKIDVCKQNITDAKTALSGLNYDWTKNIKFDGLGDKLQRELDVVKSKAAGTEKKNAADNNRQEQVAYQQKLNAVTEEYVKQLNAENDANISLAQARAKNDTKNEPIYLKQINDAQAKQNDLVTEYMNIMNSANGGGFKTDLATAYNELNKQPAVIEATTQALDKSTIAYNNLSTARDKAFDKNKAADLQEIVNAINAETEATLNSIKAEQQGDIANKAIYDTSAQEANNKQRKLMNDYIIKYNESAKQTVEVNNALADSVEKISVATNKVDYEKQKAAISALTEAVKNQTDAQIAYDKAKLSGKTETTNAKYSDLQEAKAKTDEARQAADKLGIAWLNNKSYIDAVTESQRKYNSEMNNYKASTADKERIADLNTIVSLIEKEATANAQAEKARQSGNTNSANDAERRSIEASNEAVRLMADYQNKYNQNAMQTKEVNDAITSGLQKMKTAQAGVADAQAKASDVSNAKAEKEAIDNIVDALRRKAKAQTDYDNAVKSGDSSAQQDAATELNRQTLSLGKAKSAADQLGVSWQTNKQYLDALYDSEMRTKNSATSLAAAQEKAANANDSLNASISNIIDRAKALDSVMQSKDTGKVDMTAFNQAFEEFNNIANDTSGKYSDLKVKSDALQKSFQKMGIAAGNINTALKDNSAVTRANTNFANLNAQITRFLNNNPRVSSDAGIYAQFQALATATEECSGDIDNLRMKEAQLEAQSERLGLTTETLAGKFSRLFKEHFQTAAVMAGIHLTQQGFQQVYQNVVEVDTAMTELKKVTDETDATYSAFMQTAIQQSRDLAASISDTVSATADFARLGYTLDEATDLSKAAITYQHVGDGISDISEATESIISTMKAFNIEAKDSMSIVDRFNKVGNEFAISSGNIGDALQRSASALHTAGNDINESIGMIVAANDVAQNPESVGNALKVLSLRIRGAKTELKEIGEDTETVAESTSKLQASIKGLTGVDIMKSATEFKSTYQIMDELAAKWKELDDISKASTLEQLAGKNRANVVAGMLENWQDAKAAADAARDSYGSAEAELDKYKESIAGLSEQLKASFGALSETLLDDDIVKGLLKIATGISDATNEAIKFVGVLPTLAGALSGAFAVGGPKLTGSLYVPTNTLMVTWNELAA